MTKAGISDPMGWNMPDKVERQLAAIKERWPSIKSFNLHIHNTRGMALTLLTRAETLKRRIRSVSNPRSAAWAAVRFAATGAPPAWPRPRISST